MGGVHLSREQVYRLVTTTPQRLSLDVFAALCDILDVGVEELIDEKYRGIRPAPGYPACPEHSEKATLFRLLGATAATGVELTESMAMWPGSSVSGLYLAHPEAYYFGVAKVERDQVEDYARRKGITLARAERLLAANLDYDPE